MTKNFNALSTLAEHFNGCAYFLLDQQCEFGEELSSEEEALKIFETLRESVNDIPLSVLQVTEEFMVADFRTYESIAGSVAKSVGYDFFPINAHAYVTKLNHHLRMSERSFV